MTAGLIEVRPTSEPTPLEGRPPAGWVKPTVRLVGQDGNAFAVLGRCVRAMRNRKATDEQIALFRRQATSGDYYHLLSVAMAWVEDVGEDPPESDEDG